jgi:hypothetical protein
MPVSGTPQAAGARVVPRLVVDRVRLCVCCVSECERVGVPRGGVDLHPRPRGRVRCAAVCESSEQGKQEVYIEPE